MTPIIAVTAKTEELRNRPQTTIPTAYAKVIEEAGGISVIIPITDRKEYISQIARLADGFLFSGGDDLHPKYYGEEPLADIVISPDERTEFEIELLREVMQLRKPVLGICLGAQLINVAMGGTLYQDIPSQIENPLNHRDQHYIRIVEGTTLYRIIGEIQKQVRDDMEASCLDEISIFSTHHQSVRTLGKRLIASAMSSDCVIEAIEQPDHPFLIGVQWHPEREPESIYTKSLFHALIKAAM